MRTTAGSSLIAALAAALLVPVHARAQVPDDAVAVVGSRPLTRATFDHWFKVAATSADGRVPRRYGACRQPRRRQCRAAQRGLRDETMQFLVSAYWIEGEAALQGIAATDAEVAAELDRNRRALFPRLKDFRKFRRDSGLTMDDLRYRIKLTVLSNRLRERIRAGLAPVTDEDIAAYYETNRHRFRIPLTRTIRYVHTRFAWRAQRAAQLVRTGLSWRRVAHLLSMEPRSRISVARGHNQRVLDRAIFGARLHRVEGPVHATDGYYVFEVIRIHPAHQQTLAEASSTIRGVLESQREEVALGDFVRDFQARWRSVTICRSGFVTQDCGN